MGASNIEKYVPNHSIIKVRDFESARALAEKLKYLNDHHEEYNKYFEWKKNKTMVEKLINEQENCVVNADVKLCEMAIEIKKNREMYK